MNKCSCVKCQPYMKLEEPNMETKATERPWSVGADRHIRSKDPSHLEVAKINSHSINGIETAKANAELIVRAVNSHDALMEALKRISNMQKIEGAVIEAKLALARGEA